jgi:hypothetical protein
VFDKSPMIFLMGMEDFLPMSGWLRFDRRGPIGDFPTDRSTDTVFIAQVSRRFFRFAKAVTDFGVCPAT